MSTSDDKEIWYEYAKGVKHTRTVKKAIAPLPKKPVGAEKTKPLPSLPKKQNPKIAAPEKIFFTKKLERSLRQGSITIDARLDLHGMTQAEAYAALAKFMNAQAKAGRRNLLIITGKGSSGQSVLRSNLPQWLETLSVAPFILSLRVASLKHGGSGAFYVILKRRRASDAN